MIVDPNLSNLTPAGGFSKLKEVRVSGRALFILLANIFEAFFLFVLPFLVLINSAAVSKYDAGPRGEGLFGLILLPLLALPIVLIVDFSEGLSYLKRQKVSSVRRRLVLASVIATGGLLVAIAGYLIWVVFGFLWLVSTRT